MTWAIAIVGRGCALPGAHSPEALGELSRAGACVLAPAPAGRWGLPPDTVLRRADETVPDSTWSCMGGYVDPVSLPDDIDRVALADTLRSDALDQLDPLYRNLFHASHQALVDAGFAAGGPRIGAVVGNLSFPSAAMARFCEGRWLGRSALCRPSGAPHARFMSGLPVHAMARALRLGGKAYALDAACASSLVATAQACDMLHRRRADVVLAGAVNGADDLFIHVGFRALEALSKTGRSRPFHARADGLVPAEGAAIVALMRLEDAVAAGRRVYGVIRGVGLSNDGRARGMLVPARSGQVAALRDAYRCAERDPARLSWIECHATGTLVGDATEIESLSEVVDTDEPIPMGSLKANLGHLITAAGAASLLRVVEAMGAHTRPSTPHLDAPSAVVREAPFTPLTQAQPWPEGSAPRLAGVSAFGFGGNNAHLVLEEYRPTAAVSFPAPPAPEPADSVAVVALGIRVGEHGGHRAFAEALFDPKHRAGGEAHAEAVAAERIRMPVGSFAFPPRDLEQTLPQQLLLLEVAAEAFAAVDLTAQVASERISALVGMGCDPAVARHGARWRMAGWGRRAGASEAWVQSARDTCTPLLGAAGVVGCMPNICANRLNRQWDIRGPSATFSAEELSGVVALEHGCDALLEGNIDAALVAAVDVVADPVHRAASVGMGLDHRPADGAVALLLMRTSDARARDLPVLAELSSSTRDPSEPGASVLRSDALSARFGSAHAAAGLIHVAAAVLSVAHRRALPELGGHVGPIALHLTALGGQSTALSVRPTDAASAWPDPRPEPTEPRLDLPVHLPLPELPLLEATPMPLPPAVANPSRTNPRRTSSPTGNGRHRSSAPHHDHGDERAPAPPARITNGFSDSVATVLRHRERQLERHARYLASQADAMAQFRAHQRAQWATFFGGTHLAPIPSRPTVPPTRAEVALIEPTAPPPEPVVSPVSEGGAPRPPQGPTFDRADLEVHSRGAISTIFGPRFANQDAHEVQVRMPNGRLLLADRVVGIDAEPDVLGTGTVWTETDVSAHRWFLHAGRMPAGLMIEAGQADLFLISYMGIDAFNRGERAYRLLGCEVTYRRALPRAGETLRYEIDVDGHAQQDDVRLFFFHYDCRIGDEVVLSVRHGQAGFFSDGELAASDGVIWSAERQEIEPDARVDAPLVDAIRRDYDAAAIAAFAAGDVRACFGPSHSLAQCHVATPTIQGGDMSFVDEVFDLDPRGGPWGRGYMRAVKNIRPDLWFFDGHFENDPCMPGTLMLEGCLQMMAFYLAALGTTLDRDGWRFEPVIDHPVLVRCRGQVLPDDEELHCEVFVEEFHDGPFPTLYADLLGTVNGLKAFHARRMGLRLVPDVPLSQHAAPPAPEPSGPVAEVDGFRFDYASLLACAWGKPSEAFGPMYAPFDDGLRRVPRLPGPPYHFMSRVEAVEGPLGGMAEASAATIAYDVPPDAWYFDETGGTMPFSVLLEVVLQPCGWLASYVGSACTSDVDLSFRNLDGDGVVHGLVGRDVGTLVTHTRLISIAQTGGMIIQSFSVSCRAGDRVIFTLDTVFGFFPAEALQQQVGLPVTAERRAAIALAEPLAAEAVTRGTRLVLLDRIVRFDPAGGAAGLGRIVADKAVESSAWFFRAHFYQDPVQPGSLGLEALLQLLVLFLRRTSDRADGAVFEPIELGAPVRWKYRGQVLPQAGRVVAEATIVERTTDPDGVVTLRADTSLWIDDKRIYEAEVGMRMSPSVSPKES